MSDDKDLKKNFCLGFALDEARENVLLIKKKKPDWQKGLLNGLGGKLKESELTFSYFGMVREFKEECGIETTVGQWHQIGKIIDEFGEVDVFCIQCEIMFFEQKESEELVIVPIEKLRNFKTISNIPMMVEAARFKLESGIDVRFGLFY